ncbi:MAG: serine/threonine-protein kinase, partial [Myxococcota bacterium]
MLQSGQKVDRYIVEGKVGEGGMATVYRVRHETLGTMHALKVLEITSRDVRERLVREGRLQAGLEHENVVRVTDILSVDGRPALLMEFVRGPTLEGWLMRYKPTLDESLALFRGVCLGLGYAHARGVVHRDLKPANVLLAVEEGRVVPKVTDFGLAKELQDGASSGKTRRGATMGTPEFMAPEQIRDAGAVDRRADLWSLGCLLYRLVCGVIPFQAEDVIDLFAAIANADFVPSRRLAPRVPERVHATIDGLLRVAPDLRFGDCGAVLRFLDGQGEVPERGFTVAPAAPTTAHGSWLSGGTPGERIARGAAEQQLLQLPKLDRAEFSPWNAGPTASTPTIAAPEGSEESTIEAAPPPVRSGGWAVATLVAAGVAGSVVLLAGGVG